MMFNVTAVWNKKTLKMQLVTSVEYKPSAAVIVRGYIKTAMTR